MIFREHGIFSIYDTSLCLRIHYSRLSAAKDKFLLRNFQEDGI
jgi:hypothetical protein